MNEQQSLSGAAADPEALHTPVVYTLTPPVTQTEV